jgi:hypothetical protein
MKFSKTILASLALVASLAVQADGVEWSGFGSMYYQQSFDSGFLVQSHKNNKSDFTSASQLGFNVGSRITDNMSFSGQLIAAGAGAQTENFNMFAQWAYLTFKVNDNVSIKTGRQLWPILMASEYNRVRMLLPAVGIPSTAYLMLPFTAFDGISLNQNYDIGLGNLALGVYGGSPKLNLTPPSVLDLNFANLIGARATLDGSGWRAQATVNRYYGSAKISAPIVLSAPGAVTVQPYFAEQHGIMAYSASFRYDKHNILAWLEMTKTDVSSNNALPTIGTAALYKKSYGGYALLGYRFDRITPYVSYAKGTTVYGLPTDTVTNSKYNGRVTTYLAGTSYKLNDSAVAKVEYQRDTVKNPGDGFYEVYQKAGNTKKYGDMLSAGVDFIF